MLTISQIAVWDLEIKLGQLCFRKTGTVGTDMEEVPQVANKNGHNSWSPGVSILLFARHDLCNSIFSQCPTGKIGGCKKGGQGPSWPFISRRGDMPEFSFLGTPHAARHTIQSEGMLGPTPRPWGHKGEKYAWWGGRGMPDAQRLPDPRQGSQENCSHEVTFRRVPSNPWNPPASTLSAHSLAR